MGLTRARALHGLYTRGCYISLHMRVLYMVCMWESAVYGVGVDKTSPSNMRHITRTG